MQFTKTTRTGWGKNIFNSFIGALIGVLMFLGSFVLLWTNEGRINWGEVASRSQAVDAAAPASADGRFVAASGTLVADAPIGDPPYLQPGDYLLLRRTAEMYAWVEKTDSETRNETGGGSTTTTKYTYALEWTSSPPDSSRFEFPDGHQNPPMAIESGEVRAASATVGALALDIDTIDLPSPRELRLSGAMVPTDSRARLSGSYLYVGSANASSPKVGDLRIGYEAVASGVRATVFGTLRGAAIEPYSYRDGEQLYRALEGTRDQAIKQMQGEYTATLWILRIVGFFLNWVGLMLAFGPITSFANVLPFFGNLTGKLIGLVTLPIALVLAGVTIIISAIAHNIVALIIVLALILGGIYLAGRMRKPA